MEIVEEVEVLQVVELVEAMRESEELRVVEVNQMVEEIEVLQVICVALVERRCRSAPRSAKNQKLDVIIEVDDVGSDVVIVDQSGLVNLCGWC